MNAEIIVHIGSEEGKNGTESASQDGVGGEDAGGVDGVGVDEEVHDGEEDEDHAEAERGGEDYADDPVDGGVVGPCEDEKADRDADASYHCGGKAGFWRCADLAFGNPSFFSALIALIIWDCVDNCGDHTDCDTEEGETTDAFAPAAVLLEDDGEGGEHHV